MTYQKIPPVEWVEQRPAWAVPGRNLTVVTDGPDRGRAAGLLSPAEGSVAYLNHSHGKTRAPGIGPSNGRIFHAGQRPYVRNGEVVTIQVGSICVVGGHSDTVAADTMTEGRDYLQRAGRWQDRHGELVLHGRATQTPDGILFLGAAYEWADERDIDTINATTMSPEFMWNPDTQSREFIGAARVLRTALPGLDLKEMPVAADLGETDRLSICWIDDNGTKHCDPCEDEEPIMAEVQQSDVDDLRAATNANREAVDEIRKLLEEVQSEIFDLAAKLTTGVELTAEDQLKALAERLMQLESEAKNTSKTSNPPPSDVPIPA